jgi:ketosteroid isomerase-like protein
MGENQMRLPVAALSFLMMFALAGVASASNDQTEKELISLQHQWAKARVKRDVAFLEKLYAPEFRITSMIGSMVERADDIAAFASGDLKPESVTNEDMQVSVYGDTAVVTGLEHVKGTYKGNFGDFALRFTNVFVRRDGRWQLVTHQTTPVQKK